ncbi:MAG: tetratricopeptide repeat protein [Actinomycetota bacterium]|nr:tetratricopeptide repeat protein [Actinomycetota bacterium]
MRRTRIVLAGTVAAIAATVLLLGGIFRDSPAVGAEGKPSPVLVTSGRLAGATSPSDAATLVRQLQASLRTNRNDVKSLRLLGFAYHQRYRESADPLYLTRAAGLFRRSLRLQPADPAATLGLAGLSLSQHQFRRALRLARTAQRLQPDSADSHGAVGDALIELGRYPEAFAAFDRMTALRPSLAGYARVAYGRELLGRPRAALEAMSLARDASGGRPEPAAWTLVELGKLYFGMGRIAPARAQFADALRIFPGYVYALDWLARTEAASGRYPRAVALSRRAVDAVPLPQFVATLADIRRASGDERGARREFALLGAIQRLLQANGINSDLEVALFRVDHGIRLASALELARAARGNRPSIYGDDVLAWALARNGRCMEARAYSTRALRLGTKDASFYFHRGMIERCLGHGADAARWFTRALETNPNFSLIWGDTARRYAA